MRTDLLIRDGYKYQIGFWSNGNYRRLAATKRKPSSNKISKIAEQNNVPLDRMHIQILQG